MFIHKSWFKWKEEIKDEGKILSPIEIINVSKLEKPIINDNLIELEQLLQEQSLQFRELNTRMSYGMIGHLYENDECLTLIFPGSFYMKKPDISVNKPLLRIIELIRLEFENVSRDNNGKISPVTLGKI